MAQYNQTRQNIDPMNPRCPANQWTHHPGDEMVTLEDGRVLPIKKTICLPHGNNMVPQGKRVKLTAKLREEAEMNEELLRKAAADGAMENLKNQIEKGTNVNCRAQAAGATPLICAAVGGKLDYMKYLVEAGADPHLGNGGLASPLIVAAKWGHRDVVRWLLEDCNVDPRQWDASPAPQSPIHFAREHEDKEMEQMIAQVWARLDKFDAMKLEKKEKLEAFEKEKHRKKVSREAAERRRAAEAAGTAFPPDSTALTVTTLAPGGKSSDTARFSASASPASASASATIASNSIPSTLAAAVASAFSSSAGSAGIASTVTSSLASLSATTFIAGAAPPQPPTSNSTALAAQAQPPRPAE